MANMLRCIIVDDEESAIEVLKMHIHEVGCLELVYATTKPQEALRIINEETIDLVFLDIKMPGITGLDLAGAIKGKCKVIFTTAYSKFVSEAFDLDVIDYLLKPIPLPRFMKAVQRAINIITPTQAMQIEQESLEYDYIFIKTEQKGKLLKIDLANIDYVEGMRNYVAIYHNGQKTMALLSMKDVEEKLPSKYFIRVQKSFIVAKHKISLIEGNIIKLKNISAEITIGESYKGNFMEAMKWKTLH